MKKNSRLTYTKKDGGRELKQSSVTPEQVATESVHPFPMLSLPEGYTKTDGILSYSLACVISGGTTREKVFLNELVKKHTFRGLEIIFISSSQGEGGLTPRMMQKAYHLLCKDGVICIGTRHITLEEVDAIYLFTDVDHYADELAELLATATDRRKEWIISNPDFEIWIYYCFRNAPHEELKEMLEAEPSQRSSLLKQLNGRFNNGGGLDTRKAFERIEDGIVHSRSHYSEDACGIPCLFSTQMHIFAEYVLHKLGDEFLRWKQIKATQRINRRKR